MAQPGVAWNAGMFVWQRGAIRAALERFAPDILVTVEAGLVGDRLAEAYDAVRATSIDYAVMEPAAGARAGRDGLDGRRLERPRELDRPARGDRGRGSRAGSSRPVRRPQAGADDLVVAREPGDAGGLVLLDGPRGILGTAPSALLEDARPSRDRIEALLERVSRQETTP